MANLENENIDKMDKLPYKFIEKMLDVLDKEVGQQKAGEMISQCAVCHYDILDMDSWIYKYEGKLKEFAAFLKDEWGWRVSYDETESIIMVDENKPFCVCPLVKTGGINNPSLCRCSEGFAKKMFAIVAGCSVDAKVVKSVLRGDKSCIYKIELKR